MQGFWIVQWVVLITATHATVLQGQTGQEGCVDRQIWLIGSYPCSLLLDPSSPLGFFQQRDFYCKRPTVDCCQTCARVKKMAHSSASTNADIPAATTTSAVIPPAGSTDYGTPCEDDQIWIADGSVDCDEMLNPRDLFGVFSSRVSLCRNKAIRCCKTCRRVMQLEANPADPTDKPPTSTTATSTTGKTAPSTAQTTNKHSSVSNPDASCVDDRLWIADGDFPCSDLLHPGTVSGAFKHRDTLCASSATQCCQTCRQVAQMAGGVTSTTDTPTVTANSTPTRGLPCVDSSLRVNKDWFPCSTLLDPSITRVYKSRDQFCRDQADVCCQTCKTVLKLIDTKPVVKENFVVKLVPSNGEGPNVIIAAPYRGDVSRAQVTDDVTTNTDPTKANLKMAIQVVNEGFRRFNEILARMMSSFKPI